jgi:hypothetical protein
MFIFHASDDRLLKPEVVGRYVSALKRVSPRSVEVEAPSGGHHGSMIGEGIPRAIEWVASLWK